MKCGENRRNEPNELILAFYHRCHLDWLSERPDAHILNRILKHASSRASGPCCEWNLSDFCIRKGIRTASGRELLEFSIHRGVQTALRMQTFYQGRPDSCFARPDTYPRNSILGNYVFSRYFLYILLILII